MFKPSHPDCAHFGDKGSLFKPKAPRLGTFFGPWRYICTAIIFGSRFIAVNVSRFHGEQSDLATWPVLPRQILANGHFDPLASLSPSKAPNIFEAKGTGLGYRTMVIS